MDEATPRKDRLFCERLRIPGPIEGLTIYEDPLVHASHWTDGDAPTYLGAIVLQTRRHTENGLASLTDAEGQRIGLLVAQMSRALRVVAGSAWAHTYCFTEGFRQVHQFVMARYPGMPPEHVRLGLSERKDAPHGDHARVERLVRELAQRVRPTAP
ncbi:MAG: hypothetical protein ACREDK_02330 [Thermoplasmata archaeon]